MEQLSVLIETLRQRLNQQAVANTGLFSDEMLVLSRQLDALIVKYQLEMVHQDKKCRMSA